MAGNLDVEVAVPGRLGTSAVDVAALALPLDWISILFNLLPLTLAPPTLTGLSTRVITTEAKCETN